MKKVCVVTGTRAEYGLLYWLLKELEKDSDFELQLIVTGMHLSPEYGLTREVVEKEFKIDRCIEILLSSDSAVGVSKSMGLALISFSEAFENLKPDLVVILGDRYEMLSVASCALVSRIPIAHLHGGESTEGLIDEAIRHSITKMSHLHFASTEQYRKRIIQLGEHPDTVFNVGAFGLENIKRIPLLDRDAFQQSIGFKLMKFNYLITFHPVTLEKGTSGHQFEELLLALSDLEDAGLIFTKANSDAEGKTINAMIDEFIKKHTATSVGFESLGQLRYLSAMRHVDALVGNSSSGIIEAPSFKIATVDIGDRQRGRIAASSVLHAEPRRQSILKAILHTRTKEFQRSLEKMATPYGDSYPSKDVVNVLRRADPKALLKKKFYDLGDCK